VNSFSLDYLYKRRVYVETRDPFRSLGTAHEVEHGATNSGWVYTSTLLLHEESEIFSLQFWHFIIFYSIICFNFFFPLSVPALLIVYDMLASTNSGMIKE
jgi:hypothetical protein